MNFYAQLAKLEADGIAFAIVTILHSTINSPGRTLFKMCVTDTDSFGSIGGGGVEFKMQKIAREMLRTGERMRMLSEDFNDKNGLGCGGAADILIETVIPKTPLVIFGGGHIGTALTRYANDVGFSVTVYDDREAYSTLEGHPGADHAIHASYNDVIHTPFPQDAFYVIVTHQHTGDQACLEGILRRPELNPRYVGCIGSSVKLGQMYRRMLDAGIDKDALSRVHAPIGVDNGGVTATEIAISIATELIAAIHGKDLLDAMSLKKNPLKKLEEDSAQ